MTDRTDIQFHTTDRVLLKGWLFRPDDSDEPRPAITMAHGFGATRWHGIEKAARAFADAGFVVLLHDHRGFGTSEGEPRQDVDPNKQIEDWRQAISYLEALPFVDNDRIGVWGTSFSGGHAIVLGATDRRLRAVVAQAPTIDGWNSALRRVTPANVPALEKAFDDDLRAQFQGEAPRTQKFVDLDPTVQAQYHSQDTWDFFEQPIPDGVWKNEVTLQSTRRSRMYNPGQWITRISPTPFLLIATTHDTTAPTDITLAAYERAHEPKELVLLDGGHYSPYLEKFDYATDAARTFFRENL